MCGLLPAGTLDHIWMQQLCPPSGALSISLSAMEVCCRPKGVRDFLLRRAQSFMGERACDAPPLRLSGSGGQEGVVAWPLSSQGALSSLSLMLLPPPIPSPCLHSLALINTSHGLTLLNLSSTETILICLRGLYKFTALPRH